MAANIFAAESIESMTARILESYGRADEACRVQGMTWYVEAHELAEKIAAQLGVTTLRAAALIAVLSPRASWGANKRNALSLAGMIDAPAKGLGPSIAKGRAIVAGDDLDATVGGQKVRSFWSNIADPDASDAVTIDAWAAGVALGRRLSNAEMSGLNAKQYRRLADAYRVAAATVGIRPHEMQAVAWCEFRGQTGWGKPQHQ